MTFDSYQEQVQVVGWKFTSTMLGLEYVMMVLIFMKAILLADNCTFYMLKELEQQEV